jgi:hypothetical protein
METMNLTKSLKRVVCPMLLSAATQFSAQQACFGKPDPNFTELGKPGRNEFTLAGALLDTFAGRYEREPGDYIEITRHDNQLVATLVGVQFLLFAESPAKFFAKTTDVQIEFQKDNSGQVNQLIWSVGEGANPAKRVK